MLDHTYLSAVMKQQMAHTSVRQFRDEPINDDLLQQLIVAGQSAATSSFIQAYSVIRVKRPEARKAIAEAAGGQQWIIDAAEFLVYCADLSRVNHACAEHAGSELEGYSEHSLAAVIDTALMAQNVLLAAESAGLGGVFIGGIRNNPQLLKDQLELPYRVTPLFGMCLGWPMDTTQEVKPRMPVEMILHQDTYSAASEADYQHYDATMADYYQSRSTNIKLSDWSKATAAAVQGKKREHMQNFLQQSGFFIK